jgi:hypothetical protein
MLEKECRSADVTFLVDCKIKNINHTPAVSPPYQIESSQGTFKASNLVVATGGLSIPQMGATGLGYDIAKQFGLKIVPRHPALDGFLFSESDGKAFSNDVVEEGLRRKDLWPQWENNAGTVLADIPKVMYMLKERLPADAVLGFQKAVFYVGRVVAQAASEGGGEDDIRKEVMGGGLIASIMDRFSVKTDLQMPKNISNSEKAALQKLLQSLKG